MFRIWHLNPCLNLEAALLRGVQNRLTRVSVNRFFNSKKFQTVTEPKISVNRFFGSVTGYPFTNNKKTYIFLPKLFIF